MHKQRPENLAAHGMLQIEDYAGTLQYRPRAGEYKQSHTHSSLTGCPPAYTHEPPRLPPVTETCTGSSDLLLSHISQGQSDGFHFPLDMTANVVLSWRATRLIVFLKYGEQPVPTVPQTSDPIFSTSSNTKSSDKKDQT